MIVSKGDGRNTIELCADQYRTKVKIMSKAKKTLSVILVVVMISMLALSIRSGTPSVSTEHLKYIPSVTNDRVKFRAFNISTGTITLETLLANNHVVQYQYEIDNRRYSYVSINVTYAVTTLDERPLTTGKSSMNVAPFTRGTTVITIRLPTWTNLIRNDEIYYVKANALVEGLSTADTYIPFKLIYTDARTQLFELVSMACLVAVLILNEKEMLRILSRAKGNSVTKE